MIMFQETGRAATGGGGYLQTMRKKMQLSLRKQNIKIIHTENAISTITSTVDE